MGITTSVGLVSGINISDLVDQLMAIEARPRNLLQRQVDALNARKTAWTDLSARLTALKSAAAGFDKPATFNAVAATSSNTAALTASAQVGAAQGSYQFTPVRLTANHQVVSSGFRNADSTPVGAGAITIEFGRGMLNPTTALDFLNGQAGVQRGKICITDRSGASAAVDLTTAMTVDDVLAAINGATGIAVAATVSGDSIVLTDRSGSTGQDLTVAEMNGGRTAADLGILGTGSGNRLIGNDIVSVNAATNLGQLNDGNGVRVSGGDDIQFTLEDGTELLVNLSGAKTVGEVIAAINDAAGNDGKLVAALDAAGDRLTLCDTTGGQAGPLTVTAVNASNAALDLGILGSDGDADHVIAGQRLTAGLNTVLLRNLNGGTGVAAGAISIQDRGTGSAVVDLSAAQTVQDVLDAINAAAGVAVSAALNAAGNGVALTDTSGLSLRNFVIAESGNTTAADLNILHDSSATAANSGNLQHRYISENTAAGDLGLVRGKFRITDSAGHSAVVDLTQGDETTLNKIIAEINALGIGVIASINARGDGLLLTDTAGGAGTLTVAESGSTTAASLGILGSDGDRDGRIDGSRELTVTVGAGDTLQTVAAAIAAAAKGRITAFVINDGTATNPYRLAMTSTAGGTGGRLVIDTGATGLSFSDLVRPQDALLFLGDPDKPGAIAVSARGNSVGNVVQGVTLNLVGASAAPVTVSVAASIDTAVSQIKSFVTSFNSAVDRIDKLLAFDAEANTQGVLRGESTLIRIRSSLFNMVTGSVASAPGAYARLAQIGFSVTTGGARIAFDEQKFRQAYAADPSAVSGLFTLATTGVGDRIDAVLTGITDSYGGTINRQVNGLESRRKVYTDRIAQMDGLLAAKRARLRKQFQAMESSLAQLQSQQSALAGFASAFSIANSSLQTNGL